MISLFVEPRLVFFLERESFRLDFFDRFFLDLARVFFFEWRFSESDPKEPFLRLEVFFVFRSLLSESSEI